MKVLAHSDPLVLEQELLERVAEAQSAEPLARTLVIVPTSRLAEHVQRRLAQTRAAWVGVHLLHFRSLTRTILEDAGARSPRLISPRLLEALLWKIVRDQPHTEWSQFLERRPGALNSLMASMRDLREAGISPDSVAACSDGTSRGRELATLYNSYTEALDNLLEQGWVDEAGLVRAALPHARGFGERCNAIWLHGAYELIGIHLDLIRELDAGTEVGILLPAKAAAPAYAYAEDFARRHLVRADGTIQELDDPASGGRGRLLGAIYDEESLPTPAAPGRFGFAHAQGAASEVKLAVRLALSAVRDGIPPAEIVIAARSLDPYAAHLEQSLDAAGLPWTSSLHTPLRRHPVVRDLMLILEVLERDFPRRETAEVLRSPRILWRALLAGEPFSGTWADRLSRQAGIIGGLTEWTEDLVAWASRPRFKEGRTIEDEDEDRRRAEKRAGDARRIGQALCALKDRVAPERPRPWAEHSRNLGLLTQELFHEDDEASTAAMEALRGLLEEMRGLAVVAGHEGPVPFGAMRRWLEDAVDGAELAPNREDRGGLRVLDAMQLRGLTCKRLALIGMNSGQFPRPPREDPILTDEMRRRLREHSGRPIPVKSEGVREERLLLVLLIGAAAERVDISWQRADESGRPRTPSLALRELARIVLGRPDMAALVASASHLPSHPTHGLEELARVPGLLAPEEERLLVVLRSRGPLPSLADWFVELAPGLRMLRATESFTDPGTGFDARITSRVPSPSQCSVSSLETLARCPLQYFFKYVLGVGELDEEAGPTEIAKREMGLQVHTLLQQVYSRLLNEGYLASGGEGLRQRARELLHQAWGEGPGVLAGRLARRLPVLWTKLGRSWLESLESFIEEDFASMTRRGLRLAAIEETVSREVTIGDVARLHLKARFDRRLEDARGLSIVGDYKTSGDLGKKTDVGDILRGNTLQVPLYWLLAGSGSTVELLGVGPEFPEDRDDARRVTFTGFGNDETREGFLETLRVLLSLLERGSYPLHYDEGHCGWCSYQLACRNRHPPTLERENQAGDSQNYRLLRHKSKQRRPTLAKVRSTGPRA